MSDKPKTIICDIDGTLLHHYNKGVSTQLKRGKLLEGIAEKFNEWDAGSYNVILITGRRESQRIETEKQLSSLGLFYDQLIMGVGGGDRIIINDRKPDSDRDTAYAINVDRNVGLGNTNIEEIKNGNK